MDKRAAAQILARVLADTAVLTVKTQGVHWNVSGGDFYSIHKLTESQYEDLFAAQDELAERIRALGAPAPATMAEFLKLTRLAEGVKGNAWEMVGDLVFANEALATGLLADIAALEKAGDPGSQDILVRRVQAHDKSAWLLRSTLADAPAAEPKPAAAPKPAPTAEAAPVTPAVSEVKKEPKAEKKKDKKPKKEKSAAKPASKPEPVRENPVAAINIGGGRRRLFGVKADG